MANTNLTVDQVTNRAQMVLHQKLNFIGNINRQYDDSYKTGGAKGGESVRIKLPNEFVIRTGATLSTQDVTQTAVTLTTGTQKGVDMVFSSQELTQDILVRWQANTTRCTAIPVACSVVSGILKCRNR